MRSRSKGGQAGFPCRGRKCFSDHDSVRSYHQYNKQANRTKYLQHNTHTLLAENGGWWILARQFHNQGSNPTSTTKRGDFRYVLEPPWSSIFVSAMWTIVMPTSQDNDARSKRCQLLTFYCFNYNDTLCLFQARAFYVTVNFVHVLTPLNCR